MTPSSSSSLWLQPASGSSGVLVAKTTDGGSTKFYSLSLVADGNSYIIRFSYLPASQQVRDDLMIIINVLVLH